MTKTALALGLGKSTFTRAILRMNAQLHTKANHEILHNFYPRFSNRVTQARILTQKLDNVRKKIEF